MRLISQVAQTELPYLGDNLDGDRLVFVEMRVGDDWHQGLKWLQFTIIAFSKHCPQQIMLHDCKLSEGVVAAY